MLKIFIQRVINGVILKKKKSVFVLPHPNTNDDCVDLENFSASNVLCFLNHCFAEKQLTHKFFIVNYNGERLAFLKEKYNGKNIVFVKSPSEKGISKLEKIKRWIKQFLRACTCKELWSETGGVYRYKTRSQKVVCFNYFIPFKNDYFTDAKKWSDIDYILCTSKLSAQITGVSLGVEYGKTHAVGFPRIQELKVNSRGITRAQIDEIFGSAGKKIIIYAPTYRPSKENTSTFGYTDEKVIEQALSKLNAVVVLKKHPLDRRGVDTKYCVAFQPNEKISVYDVMKHADLMVSDYSSIAYDFAMLNKPVVLNWYDEEEYLQDRGLSYEPMEPFAPGGNCADKRRICQFIGRLSFRCITAAENRVYLS